MSRLDQNETQPPIRIPVAMLERLETEVAGGNATARVRHALEQAQELRDAARPMQAPEWLQLTTALLRQAEGEARGGLSPSTWQACRIVAASWLVTPADAHLLWMEVQDADAEELGLTQGRQAELVSYLRGLTPLQAVALTLAAKR